MNEEKIFCGSGKDFHFQNGGQSLSLTIDVDALAKAYKEHGFEYNGTRYIKIKAVQKREPDQHGKTHYCEIDTYKPDQQQNSQNWQQQGQGGHNSQGSINHAPQQQAPQQGQSNNYKNYTPPSGPDKGYEDDPIPF